MNKFLVILTFFLIGSVLFTLPANAQSKDLEATLEGVKGQVEDLVNAKDEESPSDLALRIETFKKVIDFSISETKDLKIKLLALEGLEEAAIVWRDNLIKELNQALVFYEEELELIEDNTTEIDLEAIKTIASDFKKWRDEIYLPRAEEANDFLLINQEQKAIEVALRRWNRIDKDIKKLEEAKIKGVEILRELLGEADKLIEEGKEINREAEINFWSSYILTSTTTATSTPTSTIPETPPATTTTSSPPFATSSDSGATGTLSIPPVSIKGLVEDSLNKIKEAYQVFIEMSNLVRKLLS